MTVYQILKEIILDVETTNPFVWVSVRNEYDLDEQGRPFIDPTKKVFLTSFYYQDFQGVKDFLESHHVVFKGQMIMFQFKNPVKFCVPEFSDLTSNKIKGAGWTVGAYQDENFIDDDFKIPGDPNELEIEYVFKTELITNSRVDLSVQGFTPGFYWIKTKYKN